ncbi:hypothetical protein [Pontibacter sp. H249]|uniref:hypothetical protein n=1 Tax=Pontibacter sp. H249 TaxID=3133420 RepID=UPI0030C5DD95
MISNILSNIYIDQISEEARKFHNVTSKCINVIIQSPVEINDELIKLLIGCDFKFIVTLSFSGNLNLQDKTYQDLYLITLLSNYYRVGGLAVIPVFNSHPSHSVSHLVSKIESVFSVQRNNKILLPVFSIFDSSQQIIDDKGVTLVQPEMFSSYEFQTKLLTHLVNRNISSLILCRPLNAASRRAEQDNNCSIGVCLNTVIEQKNEVENLIHEKSLLQERVEVYRNFLNISKEIQEKEYKEVLDWYHKEYEVLPLWFKRIGHLVKVMLGKRSIGSIFK